MSETTKISNARKAHTGEHILFRALSTVFDGLTVKKVELGERNYFLVHYDKELEYSRILKAELIANQIINEGRAVEKILGSRNQIKERFPQLRVRWDRITDDTVTVVEVKDYDWAACVGDHVENTKEIEYIIVTRVNSVGKGYYEVEFEVAEKAKKEALKRSALARELSSLLRTSLDKVMPTIKNLKGDHRHLTESVRALTTALAERVLPEDIEGISVFMQDFSGGDRKIIQKTAAKLAQNGNNLVIFVEQSQNVFLVMACSPSTHVDCRDLLTTVFPDAKGGGKPEYVTASSPEKIDLQPVKLKIRRFVKQSRQKEDSSSPKSP